MRSKYREPRHTQLKHCMVWKFPKLFFFHGSHWLLFFLQSKSILVISILNQNINAVWPPFFSYQVCCLIPFFFRRRMAWSKADRYNRFRLSEFLHSSRDICCQHVWGWFRNQNLHWWETEIDFHSQVSLIALFDSASRVNDLQLTRCWCFLKIYGWFGTRHSFTSSFLSNFSPLDTP